MTDVLKKIIETKKTEDAKRAYLKIVEKFSKTEYFGPASYRLGSLAYSNENYKDAVTFFNTAKKSLEKNDIIELDDIETVLVEKKHQTSFFSTKKELLGRKLKTNLEPDFFKVNRKIKKHSKTFQKYGVPPYFRIFFEYFLNFLVYLKKFKFLILF